MVIYRCKVGLRLGQNAGHGWGKVGVRSKVGAREVGARSGQSAWAWSGHKLLETPGVKCWARSGQKARFGQGWGKVGAKSKVGA